MHPNLYICPFMCFLIGIRWCCLFSFHFIYSFVCLPYFFFFFIWKLRTTLLRTRTKIIRITPTENNYIPRKHFLTSFQKKEKQIKCQLQNLPFSMSTSNPSIHLYFCRYFFPLFFTRLYVWVSFNSHFFFSLGESEEFLCYCERPRSARLSSLFIHRPFFACVAPHHHVIRFIFRSVKISTEHFMVLMSN